MNEEEKTARYKMKEVYRKVIVTKEIIYRTRKFNG